MVWKYEKSSILGMILYAIVQDQTLSFCQLLSDPQKWGIEFSGFQKINHKS